MSNKVDSIEQLLKPRYKVIGLWPNSGGTKVGDIIQIELDNTGFHFGGATHFGPVVSEEKLKSYPHLFKKLEWWEDRKPEEIPQYAKPIKAPEYVFRAEFTDTGMVYCKNIKGEVSYHQANIFLPATEAEYLNQNKKQ
jgi:hypothetical protein